MQLARTELGTGSVRDFLDGNSASIGTTILGMDGSPLGPASLSSLTVTLYDRDSQAVINEREAQDVLNANGGTLTDAGVFVLELGEDDMAIQGDPDRDNYFIKSRDGSLRTVRPTYREWHVALLEWETTSGETGSTEIGLRVRNQHFRPAA